MTYFFLGVVFEDAPSGVQSGREAGCKTVGLLTTHTREQMEAAQPDILIQDLSRLVLLPPVFLQSGLMKLFLEFLFGPRKMEVWKLLYPLSRII